LLVLLTSNIVLNNLNKMLFKTLIKEIYMSTSNAAVSSAATSAKAFILAHPLSVAVVGGALIGMGTYSLMKKFSGKSKELPAATTA
jgi:F0F1-type ATP synthase assembly protein I